MKKFLVAALALLPTVALAEPTTTGEYDINTGYDSTLQQGDGINDEGVELIYGFWDVTGFDGDTHGTRLTNYFVEDAGESDYILHRYREPGHIPDTDWHSGDELALHRNLEDFLTRTRGGQHVFFKASDTVFYADCSADTVGDDYSVTCNEGEGYSLIWSDLFDETYPVADRGVQIVELLEDNPDTLLISALENSSVYTVNAGQSTEALIHTDCDSIGEQIAYTHNAHYAPLCGIAADSILALNRAVDQYLGVGIAFGANNGLENVLHTGIGGNGPYTDNSIVIILPETYQANSVSTSEFTARFVGWLNKKRDEESWQEVGVDLKNRIMGLTTPTRMKKPTISHTHQGYTEYEDVTVNAIYLDLR